MAEINWSLLQTPDFAGNALAYRRAGIEDRQQQQLQTARTTAGNALSHGDYTGASSALYGAGDIAGGYNVQRAATDQQRATDERSETLLKATASVAGRLANVYDETKDPAKVLAAYDLAAGDLQRFGATPEQLSKARSMIEADPQTATLALGAGAAKKLGYDTNVVGDELIISNKENGQVVGRYRGAKVLNIAPGASAYEIPGSGGGAAVPGPPGSQAAPMGGQGGIGGQSPADAQAAATGPVATTPTSGAPRNQRNNNPGNIEDGPFAQSLPGYAGTDGRFAIFADPQAGSHAQVALLSSYGKRGINTVSSIVNRWAPPSDGNDTAKYIDYVSRRVGVGPDQSLDMNDPATLSDVATAIQQYEGGPASASNQAAPPAPQAAPAPAAGQAAAAPQAPPGGRLLASNPKPPPPQSRPATPAEKAAFGIAASVPAQMKPDGTIDVIDGAQGGMSPKEQRVSSIQLRKEFEQLPEVKQFNTVATQYDVVRRLAAAKPTAPNDVSMIFAYMKILDPTSVVREGEFATAQNTVGIPGQIVNAYNKALNGQRLSDQQRSEFLQAAGNIYQANHDRYGQVVGQYKGYATQMGLPDETITARPDVTSGGGAAGQAKPPQGARQGQNGKFYMQDPTSKKPSFPEVRQATDGNWYFKGSDGAFYRVKH